MKPIHVVAAVVAVLALAPAAAQAQTITACYVPKTGSMYRIEAAGAPDACKASHVEFSWLSGNVVYTRHVSATMVIAPNDFEQATASCEAGETLVTGGHATNPNSPVSVAASLPQDPPSQAWFVDVRNLSGTTVEAWAYALCAKPAS